MSEKKIALVTGGTSGIGRATVLELASRGFRVAFTYRNAPRAEEVCRELEERGLEGMSIECDIIDTDQCRAAVRRTEEKWGRIDVLVNCAGISNVKTVEEIDEVEWDTMLDTNLRGTFFLTKAVYAGMKERRSGTIISVTSIAGQRGGRFSGVHYCASKGGMEAMVKCFARIGAEYGITSNGVSPGVVDTPMTREEGVVADDVPLGRAAVPEEVARVIAFLASKDAGYITGMTIDVNGGQMMR